MNEPDISNNGCDTYAAKKIVAFLDGELTKGDVRATEEHLKSCESCAAELQRQRQARGALYALARELVAPPALRDQIRLQLETAEPAKGSRLQYVLPAAIAAVLAVILSTGFWLRSALPEINPTVIERVVQAQLRADGQSPVSLRSSDPSLVAQWARTQTGTPFGVPSLESAGYRLLGARLEPDAGKHAITLVYEGAQGRLTCTIYPLPAPLRLLPEMSNSPIRVRAVNGSSIATWRDGDAVYMLAADIDRSTLLRIAQLAAKSS
jgi:anti-sigma factor RsiW